MIHFEYPDSPYPPSDFECPDRIIILVALDLDALNDLESWR